jgi:hypothetical protein
LTPIELIWEIKIRHAAKIHAKEDYSIKKIAFQIDLRTQNTSHSASSRYLDARQASIGKNKKKN